MRCMRQIQNGYAVLLQCSTSAGQANISMQYVFE
jgi:hypothetical protein